MRSLLALTLALVAGVLIGIGGVLGVLVLLQDGESTSVVTPTTGEKESISLAPKSRIKNIEPLGQGSSVSVPSNVDELDFPKHAFDRTATIVSWVAALTEEQILGWLEQSTNPSWQVSHANRSELQSSLLQKLSISAPNRALDFVLARKDQARYSMITIVFRTWASADLNSAIESAKDLNEHESHSVLSAILDACDDLPLDRLREIANELGNEHVAFTNYFRNLSKKKVENPKETWYEVVNLASRENVQDLAESTLVGIAVAWVEDQGMSVLDEITSSISSDPGYTYSLSRIFVELSIDQPEKIFDYVMNKLGDQAFEIIQSGIAHNWARKDPKALLRKAQTLSAGRFQQNLIYNAVGQWAYNNPGEMLEQLELIPPSHRYIGSSNAIGALTRTSPTEAASFVLQIADDEQRSQLAQSLISSWVYVDAKAAKDWVLGLPTNEPLRTSLITPLTSALVQIDPRGAFELALQQPFQSMGLEASILSMISYQDVQLAIELLPQVREGGKSFAFSTVGNYLVRQGEIQQALGLAESLNDDEQTQYYQVIAKNWSMSDPQGLLESFDDFPTVAKSKIALALTWSNIGIRNYSDEEIARIEKYISKEDKELLDQLQEVDMNDPSPADLELIQRVYSW